ncbi:MAG: ArsA family ATPase [Alphaproteobacteria bacterium]
MGGGGEGDDLPHFDHRRPVDDGPLARIHDRLVARRQRFETMRAAPADPSATGFVLVLVPERLPLKESDKARARLQRFGIEVGCVLVNRVLPDDAEGAFLAVRREREQSYLDDIDRSFRDLPRPRVPLVATDVVGIEALARIAAMWR